MSEWILLIDEGWKGRLTISNIMMGICLLIAFAATSLAEADHYPHFTAVSISQIFSSFTICINECRAMVV